MANFTAPPRERREMVPEGNHLARCISFIDLGTQKIDYKGQLKMQRKINLTWEIPGEMRVFNEEKGEQPMVISRDFTLSFFGQSALFKILQSWIGFKEGDDNKFDPEKMLLGKPAIINVVQKMAQSGNEYATIVSVTAPMKGQVVPDQIMPETFFFMGYAYLVKDFDEQMFDVLPEFMKAKIQDTAEYTNTHGALGAKQAEKEEAKVDGEDSDLPEMPVSEVVPSDLPF